LFAIEFVAEALLELQSLCATDQRRVVNAIETHLAHEPAKTARRRKQLVAFRRRGSRFNRSGSSAWVTFASSTT
jgi:hypothetical protein